VHPGAVIANGIEVEAAAHIEAPWQAEAGRAFEGVVEDGGGW
jgi:hypothetical protein